MLSTFVIGLREGVEAALIIGIIAAFLRQEGRGDALRFVWAGVVAAVLLCVGVGVLLNILDRELPEHQQQILETLIALVAVAAVSYMIVWMRRNARGLRARLQAETRTALIAGSVVGLVLMAFLSVLREGFETAVFLLAAFQNSNDTVASVAGAALGIGVAIAIGYGIYRGGVHLDLARFFRLTGIVLVFVAAGLLASAVHSAGELGWIGAGQGQALDLSAVISDHGITGALATGMFGVHPQPTTAEVIAYFLYAIPMVLYVAWPQQRRPAQPSKTLQGTGPAGGETAAPSLSRVPASSHSVSSAPTSASASPVRG